MYLCYTGDDGSVKRLIAMPWANEKTLSTSTSTDLFNVKSMTALGFLISGGTGMVSSIEALLRHEWASPDNLGLRTYACEYVKWLIKHVDGGLVVDFLLRPTSIIRPDPFCVIPNMRLFTF